VLLRASPGEAQLWIEGEKLDHVIEVPGCYSPLYCNAAKDHCLVITGMGKANAAATIMAVGLSDSGGHMLAIQNAYLVGSVVTQHIITHWDEWRTVYLSCRKR